MKRGGQLKRGKGLSRKRKARPQEGPLTPYGWKLAVFAAAGGHCLVTGRRLDIRRDDAHHFVRKEELRARKLYDMVWDPRNGGAVRSGVHTAHENASRRIPRDKVPDSAWEFARELGEWAVVHIERHHPEPEEEPHGAPGPNGTREPRGARSGSRRGAQRAQVGSRGSRGVRPGDS